MFGVGVWDWQMVRVCFSVCWSLQLNGRSLADDFHMPRPATGIDMSRVWVDVGLEKNEAEKVRGALVYFCN